jgi:hypothetical protein
MIFMSQSGITDPTQEPQWAQWYFEHLRIMRTVDGITSAERFQTKALGWPPSLAMYSIRSPEVFVDPYYQKIRGMGPWLGLIDKRFYQRNLFERVATASIMAPEVPAGSVLVVTDQSQPTLGHQEPAFESVTFTWLRAVGLDQSTPCRGICVMPHARALNLPMRADVALYTPAQPA